MGALVGVLLGLARRLELSTNGTDWSTVYSTTAGVGGAETLNMSGITRYTRMCGVSPVNVLDPSTPDIQGKLDAVFEQQESAPFGTGRHALLFKPGTYTNINAQFDFCTQIAGLGLRPDDTTLNGDVTVSADWAGGDATQNFWRSAESLALNPVSGTDRWAVAQESSFRRMHVKGDHLTFSGAEGAPANSSREPRCTTLDTTPVCGGKPFLYLDGGEMKVFAPVKRVNARGTTRANTTPQGESIPLSKFYVAEPGATAVTVDAALAQGLNLLFTPGIYHVDQPVQMNRPNTIVLGLGLAPIVPDSGVAAMKVADVDGVRLAGFLIDAGPVDSPTLLETGPSGANADHSADPTTKQDVSFRIGGAGPGKATTSLVVNSDDTIIDHTWVWHADHGDGVGRDANRADYGVRVNGDDLLATGLFVEHFNKVDVEFSGERGRTISFQNEKAYDAPNQAAIRNGTTTGYAAYKVDDSVTTHEAWGMGSYCDDTADPSIRQDHGFAAPVKPGVRFPSLPVVSLGGSGQYEHVTNGTGRPASGNSTTPSTVVSCP